MADVFAIPEAGTLALLLRGERALDWLFFTSLGLLLPLAALFTGASARLRNAIGRFLQRPFLAAMAFYLVYVLLEALLVTPLAWYRGYELLHRHDLIYSTPWQWALERVGRAAAEGVMAAPLVAFGLWLVRASPRHWWKWCALTVAPWLFLMTVIYPHVVEPLFTDSYPLAEGRLKQDVAIMAMKASIRADSIVVAGESARSRSLNANVSGVGSSVRIALHDNLLRGMNRREVQHVVAHEIGHHALGHVWLDFLAGMFLATLVLYGIARRAPASIERNRRWWKVESLHDPAAIPLVIFWVNVAIFFASPLQNTYMRWQEDQADRYALELVRDPIACATAVRKLGNLAVPDPPALEHAILGTHPTVAERLAQCKSAVKRS